MRRLPSTSSSGHQALRSRIPRHNPSHRVIATTRESPPARWSLAVCSGRKIKGRMCTASAVRRKISGKSGKQCARGEGCATDVESWTDTATTRDRVCPADQRGRRIRRRDAMLIHDPTSERATILARLLVTCAQKQTSAARQYVEVRQGTRSEGRGMRDGSRGMHERSSCTRHRFPRTSVGEAIAGGTQRRYTPLHPSKHHRTTTRAGKDQEGRWVKLSGHVKRNPRQDRAALECRRLCASAGNETGD